MSDNKTTQTAETFEIKPHYGPEEYKEYKKARDHLNAVQVYELPTIKKEAGAGKCGDIFIIEGNNNSFELYGIIRRTKVYIMAQLVNIGYRTGHGPLKINTYLKNQYTGFAEKRIKKTTNLTFINCDSRIIAIEINEGFKFKMDIMTMVPHLFNEFKEFMKFYPSLLPYKNFRDYKDIFRPPGPYPNIRILNDIHLHLTLINGITKNLNINSINELNKKAEQIAIRCKRATSINFISLVLQIIAKEANISQFLEYTTANPSEVDLTRMP